MPSHFTLRMQFRLNQDSEKVRAQVLDLVRRAPVDEIMFFFYAEELNDGHETLDEIKQWIEHSRPVREAVKKEGVAVSLNQWHTQLHGDFSRRLKDSQPWQTMVDPHGRQAEAQVCSLDPGWRAFYAEQLALYGPEKFRVIWIDDDIRFHNHAPLDWGGCFCPLHVDAFNRRSGLKASREEIVKNCTAAGEPHPWRGLWMDMWDETQTELIASWRDILAPFGTKLGLMSSVPEVHAAEGRKWQRWWDAFGGANPPVHRPHFCSYGETLGRDITGFIATLDQNRAVHPEVLESGTEVDNGLYGPWNKPYSETMAQLALSHVLGSTGINISLFDFMGNDFSDEPERVDWVKAWHPLCDWLADEFPMTMKSTGVGIPWSEDVGRRMHTDGSGRWQSLICPTRSWTGWLGAAGIAYAMREQAVNALAGPVVWTFAEGELTRMLGGGLLLDAEAAVILIERGFGEAIGFTGGRLVTQAEQLFAMERCTDPEFSLRKDAYISVNRTAPFGMFQGEPVKGVREVSELIGPKCRRLGHGATVFENKAGGRVAIVPFKAGDGPHMFTQRAVQLQKLVAWLDRDDGVGFAGGGGWLVPQFLNDGSRWRGVVWNGGADAVSNLALTVPQAMQGAREAVQVQADGTRLAARIENGMVILPQPMHCWEFVVLR